MGDSTFEASRQAATAWLAEACPDLAARAGAWAMEILPDGRQMACRPAPTTTDFPGNTGGTIDIEDGGEAALAAAIPERARLTCVIGLERARHSVLLRVLTRLASVSGDWLTIAVNTHPAGSPWAHRTVLHVDGWSSLLKAAGWAEVRRQEPATERAGLLGAAAVPSHWRCSDPFRDAAAGGSWLVVLRRIDSGSASETQSAADVRSRLIAVLDRFGLASAVQPRSSPHSIARVGFIVGGPQDYHMLRPLFDVMPAARRVVIMRQGLGTPRTLARRALVLAHMELHGYEPIHTAGLDQIPWDELDAVVTASESTANSDHLLNASFVIAARARGIPTCQLQHGIVPLADFASPAVWFSEQFLAWGPDVRQALALNGTERHDPGRVLHAADRMDYTITGCPKFDVYANPASVRPADLFGAWAARFTRMCLIATNLHWAQHRSAGDVWATLCGIADRRPGELFVLKMHPVEEPLDPGTRNVPANLIVLDDRSALDAGLDSTRLILASNVVICTLSTIALEAALARRPCIVLDTGNPNTYRGVSLTALANLPHALDAIAEDTPDMREFLDTYYASGTLGAAGSRVLDAITQAARRRSADAIDPAWRGLAALAETLAGREGHAAALEAAVAHKDAYNLHLHDVILSKDQVAQQLLEAVRQRDRRIAVLERELVNQGHPVPKVS